MHIYVHIYACIRVPAKARMTECHSLCRICSLTIECVLLHRTWRMRQKSWSCCSRTLGTPPTSPRRRRCSFFLSHTCTPSLSLSHTHSFSHTYMLSLARSLPLSSLPQVGLVTHTHSLSLSISLSRSLARSLSHARALSLSLLHPRDLSLPRSFARSLYLFCERAVARSPARGA